MTDWAKDDDRRAAAQRAEGERHAGYLARLTQEQGGSAGTFRCEPAQEAGRPRNNRMIRFPSHGSDDADVRYGRL